MELSLFTPIAPKTMKHPLESFGYCPRCGSSGLEHVYGRAIHCAACELTYFHNVAAAVACFVRDAAGRTQQAPRGVPRAARHGRRHVLEVGLLTGGAVDGAPVDVVWPRAAGAGAGADGLYAVLHRVWCSGCGS